MDEMTRHCVELLAPLGSVRAKRMFGGVGLYVDDIFIALIGNEQLYLKADDQTRTSFESVGCEPFRFVQRSGETMTLSYYRAPEEAMESSALMLPWARMALQAALRKRDLKPARKRKVSRP